MEIHHRELKQTWGIERYQARSGRAAQRNHILMAISAWIQQSKRRYRDFTTLYRQKWEILKQSHRNSPQHASHPKPLTSIAKLVKFLKFAHRT